MKLINIDKQNYEIVVIGMGYVGLTYSLHLNNLGYKVIGLEKDNGLVDSINNKVWEEQQENQTEIWLKLEVTLRI